MKIKALTLKDFARFKVAEFEFKPGLNLIVGPNGSGKTTILEAISFLLFEPRIRNSAGYIHFGSKSFNICCDFEHSDVEYRIEKMRSSQGLFSKFYQNGKILSTRSEEIVDLISRLVSTQSSLSVWYLPQGHTAAFIELFLNKKFRDILENLFGIGDIDFAERRLSVLIDREFPFNPNELNSTESRLQITCEEINKLRNSLLLPVSRYKEIMHDTEQKLKENENKRVWISLYQEYQKKLEEISILEKKLSDLQTIIKQNKEAHNEAAEAANILVNKYSARLDKFFTIYTISDLISVLKTIELQNQEISTLLKEFYNIYPKRPKITQKRLQALYQEKAILDVKLSEYKYDPINILGTKCPLCGQALSEEHIKRIQEEFKQIKIRLQELVNSCKDAEEKIRIRAKCKSLLSNLKDKIRKNPLWRFPAEELRKDILDLQKCQSTIFETHDRFYRLEDEQRTVKEELQEKKKNLSEVPNPDFDLQQIEEEKKILEQIYVEAAYNLKLAEHNEARLAELNLTKANYEELLKKLMKEDKFRKFCKAFVNTITNNLFLSFKQYVSEYILYKVNEYLSLINFPARLVVQNDLDAFNVELFFSDGRRIPFERMSYGQKVIISLAFAFVFYLSNSASGILLADEPTAGLDIKNISGLNMMLHKLADACNTYGIQCIMTTHHEEFFSANNVITLA